MREENRLTSILIFILFVLFLLNIISIIVFVLQQKQEAADCAQSQGAPPPPHLDQWHTWMPSFIR